MSYSEGSEVIETTSNTGYRNCFIIGGCASGIAFAFSLFISGHFTICNNIFKRMVAKKMEKPEIELEDFPVDDKKVTVVEVSIDDTNNSPQEENASI